MTIADVQLLIRAQMGLLQRLAAPVRQIPRRGCRVAVAGQVQTVQRLLRDAVHGVLCKLEASIEIPAFAHPAIDPVSRVPKFMHRIKERYGSLKSTQCRLQPSHSRIETDALNPVKVTQKPCCSRGIIEPARGNALVRNPTQE